MNIKDLDIEFNVFNVFKEKNPVIGEYLNEWILNKSLKLDIFSLIQYKNYSKNYFFELNDFLFKDEVMKSDEPLEFIYKSIDSSYQVLIGEHNKNYVFFDFLNDNMFFVANKYFEKYLSGFVNTYKTLLDLDDDTFKFYLSKISDSENKVFGKYSLVLK